MSASLLKQIANEVAQANPERRGMLLRRLSDLYIARRGKIEADIVDEFCDLCIGLLAGASLFERMAFSNALADGGEAPKRLVDHVLRDVYLVARPLIERGPLSESRLMALLDDDDREVTQEMIGQRRNVGVQITDRLVAGGNMKVLLAVASNPSASLSPATFDKLGDIAAALPDMDTALARRSDLPLAIAKRLHRVVGRSSADRVASLMAKDAAKRRSSLVLRG